MADLADVVNSTLNLLHQFDAALSVTTQNNPATQLPADPPEPLDVLYDAAKLLKAQTTKLSLLILNKPFTPSAISSVVRHLASTCLPAMMSAVEICRSERYSKILQNEAKARVRRIFKQMEKMMFEVVAASKSRGGVSTTRDSLASTGVVWEACDDLAELKQIGLIGLVVQKAEQYRDTLKDAIEELDEWAEGADVGDEKDIGASGDEAESVEDLFDAPQKLAKGETELRNQLKESLQKLKMISMLYQALIKRRLKTFTINQARSKREEDDSSHSESVAQLDRLLEALRALPHKVDELAIAFYDLDGDLARSILSHCCKVASDAATLASLNWAGESDEFTTWSQKWLEVISKDR